MYEHRHRAVPKLRRVGPFICAVVWPENVAAHGNIMVTDRCRCGQTRLSNINGLHIERGPWHKPQAVPYREEAADVRS